MACTLRRKDQVERLVLDYFRRRRRNPSIRRGTKMSRLRLDRQQKDSYHRGIAASIREGGCSMRGFTPTQFRAKKTVGEIGSAAWNAVRENAK